MSKGPRYKRKVTFRFSPLMSWKIAGNKITVISYYRLFLGMLNLFQGFFFLNLKILIYWWKKMNIFLILENPSHFQSIDLVSFSSCDKVCVLLILTNNGQKQIK